MLPAENERDGIIVVEDTLELEKSVYFYLVNRQYIGQF